MVVEDTVGIEGDIVVGVVVVLEVEREEEAPLGEVLEVLEVEQGEESPLVEELVALEVALEEELP